MRLFVALDIDDAIRDRIARFVEGVRGFAPDARWVRPESLHVTLKFIGEKPSEALEAIRTALRDVDIPEFTLSFRSYGFFPTPSAPRIFWIGVQSGDDLPRLAASVDQVTTRFGIPKEDHPFSPHLTLARRAGGSGAPHRQEHDSPNRSFQQLAEKLGKRAAPEFGTMSAREFFLYQSQPSRNGSIYTKLERYTLRASAQTTATDPENP